MMASMGIKIRDKFKMNFKIVFGKAGQLIDYVYIYYSVGKGELKDTFRVWRQGEYKKDNIIDLEETVGEVYLKKRGKVRSYLDVLS